MRSLQVTRRWCGHRSLRAGAAQGTWHLRAGAAQPWHDHASEGWGEDPFNFRRDLTGGSFALAD
eukprot:CAMPEP_0195098130 /NCGR_PEP_ID=MMETSP0448-20130528/56375_1 /TAXON_ID=66468 /ORGANISM="Heterocapsa triquestra, Strain CCMP 448" /LENGTH=63 /DNA_ID=CAMNT_0040132785 /DNA_START=219 /DNA_END=407 /DNA_ORIENTATION=-